MNFHSAIKRLSFFGFVLSVFVFSVNAQSVIFGPAKADKPVVAGNNLHCAGYIQSNSISTANRIVGANGEADGYNFAQNDFLYINMGSDKGVSVGDNFAVVRPRGQVESRWTHKNDVGFYVQEVGTVEVVRVKSDVSVVKVNYSCDSLLLGDLVQLTDKRVSPMSGTRPAFDEFADPSGKATGRILMARDGAEMLSRDFIVYVDLGAEDNVRTGDYLTIFRPLGKGNLFKTPQVESVSARDEGFQSNVYRGGKFSNQAARKSGDKADGTVVTTDDAKRNRGFLRKVVGEGVVLNVKERTATVVITRTAQEIHTGDWVEIQ